MKGSSMMAGKKLTYQDLLQLPPDYLRHELIGGKHHATGRPDLKHQTVVTNLGISIHQYLRTRDMGEVFMTPVDVKLTDHDVVEPDVLFVSRERLARQNGEYIAEAPELVVEVLSRTTRRIDEGAKHRLYERFGVGEYWRVDPVRETVRVFRHRDGRFELVGELGRGAVLTTPFIPGLELRLDTVFKRIFR